MGGRGSSLINKHISGNDDKQDGSIKFNIDDPESEIHNDMFKKLKEVNISTRESTDSIDDIILGRQQQQILNIASKYKNVLQNTTRNQDIQFGVGNIQDETLGYCQIGVKEGKIVQRVVLNSKQLKNYDKILNTVIGAVNRGLFAPINLMFKSRDYVVTHELGHAVENSMIQKMVEDNNYKLTEFNVGSIKKQLQQKIQNDIIKLWEEKYKKESDKLYLSKYSTKTPGEWFAETFANSELADNPASIAQALQEYIGRFNV